MKHKKKIMLLLDLLIIAAGIALDRFTKLWAIYRLKEQEPIELINGVLELHYLENRGAAFGILQDQKIIFIIMTTIISAALIYILLKMPAEKQYRLLHVGGSALLAGAVGNFWDRLYYDYVVDFIYFSLIDFPIFNVADMYVSVTCVFAIILVLFGRFEETDFSFLSLHRHKKEKPEE